ncbi:MAG: type I-C CRISPR-associated protein Cas8c/Csd1 [Eubacteriales bacterium]|jgi:CRISPR-associated protein Csd1
MSIFHVLYQSYIRAEEKGIVDNLELDMTKRNIVVLPIYHTNLRSKGNDVLQIVLDDKGVPDHLNFIERDTYIIFPITEDSLNRTSNVFAHPLCDDMQYLSKSLDEEKYTHYCEQNELWLNGVLSELSNCADQRVGEVEDIKVFLQQIREMVLSKDILKLVEELIAKQYKVLEQDDAKAQEGAIMSIEFKPATKESKAEIKKINLSKAFITFGKYFTDAQKRDIDITKNRLLHQAHIRYIQRMQAEQTEKFDLCDISGQRMYCTDRNRGLLGRGKIISVSNHTETYRGRFRDGSEVVRLGADTSEKIHLMLKFFLEHRDNAQGLYNNTTAVIWFSDDILNRREFSLYDPTAEASDSWNNLPEEEYESRSLSDVRAVEWKKILRGEKALPKEEETDFFYFMTINKISNGRIAIQSTRTMPITTFLKNLQHWNKTCSWERWNFNTKEYEDRTPRPWDIVRFVYGIEKDDGRVDCLKDELKSLAFQRLLPAIIDGLPLPKDMGRQIFSNYKNRIGFEKNWPYLQYMSCALLNKVRQDKGKERRLPMLEKDKQTRDYLYGRLLAVYEKVETDAMTAVIALSDAKVEGESQDKSKSSRITNVEKVWAAFFQSPERMLGMLHTRIRPYLNKLKADRAGSYYYYNRLIGEIQTDIRNAESYLVNKNKALNEDAVFGYYAQNRELYKSRVEKKENENA